MKPKRMYVWNRPEQPKDIRIVIAILDDGRCVAVDGCYDTTFTNNTNNRVCVAMWLHCEEIIEKKMRPMTHAEINRWWWDNVRSGNNPARKNTNGDFKREIFLFPPFLSESPEKDMVFCSNYTGNNDSWVKLEVEE